MINAITKPHRWDPIVKLTHWGIVTAVIANAIITEEGSGWHIWVGYGLAGLLALRLLWGIIGPAEARFSAFPPSPVRALAHLGEIRRGEVTRHRSHNPLGALMVYAIWATLLVIIGSGIAMSGPPPANPAAVQGERGEQREAALSWPDTILQAVIPPARADEDDGELAEEQAEAAQRLREQIEAALGQPIHNPSQYQTPEAMMAAGMRQWQRQQQADDERKSAKRAARKAKNKPAVQEKAELQQTDAKTTLRTIYRQLASALHPDREPDEQERQRKTALMSEVNAAYEKADLTTLMRLQMQITQVAPGASSRLADDKLMAMCALLKEQVSALEDDLDQLQFRLSRELCMPVRADADEAAMTQALQRMQADQRHEVDSLQADLRRIQSEAEFKRWLKEQAQLAKEKAREDVSGWWG